MLSSSQTLYCARFKTKILLLSELKNKQTNPPNSLGCNIADISSRFAQSFYWFLVISYLGFFFPLLGHKTHKFSSLICWIWGENVLLITKILGGCCWLRCAGFNGHHWQEWSCFSLVGNQGGFDRGGVPQTIWRTELHWICRAQLEIDIQTWLIFFWLMCCMSHRGSRECCYFWIICFPHSPRYVLHINLIPWLSAGRCPSLNNSVDLQGTAVKPEKPGLTENIQKSLTTFFFFYFQWTCEREWEGERIFRGGERFVDKMWACISFA